MLDPRFLELGLKFYSLCSRWLTKLACGMDEMDETEVDLSKLDLPLKLPVPMAFATLPEFFGTDCCEYLLLLAEFKGSVLVNASDEFDRILSLIRLNASTNFFFKIDSTTTASANAWMT
eukprot:COSAG02_NODE_13465_length_1391_cov_2.779412_1_plen_119_part_10